MFDAGTIFAKDFRFVRPLRTGGMGTVFVVEQLSTGKLRALKLLSPSFAADPWMRERFVQEARVGAEIDSDHVVEVVTAGVDDVTGTPYLAMELLRGEDLGDALDRIGPLPLGDVADILEQVGHAVSRAHARGIVHRDLKPDNVFLSVARGRASLHDSSSLFMVKVLDFGIAKLTSGGSSRKTRAVGTPAFMSPEQTDADKEVSPATDVWSLGLITFVMLTGTSFWRVPDSAGIGAIIKEICVDPIPGATERALQLGVAHHLPFGFDAWFARCVDREPKARFPEAGEAVRAFLSLVNEEAERTLSVTEEGVSSDRASRPSLPAGARKTPRASKDPSPIPSRPGHVVIRDLDAASAPMGIETSSSSPASVRRRAGEMELSDDGQRASIDLLEANAVRSSPPSLRRSLGPDAPPRSERVGAETLRHGTPTMRPSVEDLGLPRTSLAVAPAPRPRRARLVLVALAVVALLGLAAFALSGFGTGREMRAPASAAAAATESNADVATRRARACEASRYRMRSGVRPTQIDVEGWVAEIWLARSAKTPLVSDPKLTSLVNGGRLSASLEAELGTPLGGSAVVLDAGPSRMQARAPGWPAAVVQLDDRYVAAMLDPATRPRLERIAEHLATAVGADAAALYARCAHLEFHDLGSWFRGNDAGSAAATLVYAVGAFAETPIQVPTRLDLLGAQLTRVDRPALEAAVTPHGGRVEGRGPIVIRFEPDARPAALLAARALAAEATPPSGRSPPK